jgi:hypothetical protein
MDFNMQDWQNQILDREGFNNNKTTNTTIMKKQFSIGTFETNNGNIFEITNIITETMLNTFCKEPIMYEVIWMDGKTKSFSPTGIRSIIKNQ